MGESDKAYVCVPRFCFLEDLYSVDENAIVVLTRHFDFLQKSWKITCSTSGDSPKYIFKENTFIKSISNFENDDCHPGGWAIITVLGG